MDIGNSIRWTASYFPATLGLVQGEGCRTRQIGTSQGTNAGLWCAVSISVLQAFETFWYPKFEGPSRYLPFAVFVYQLKDRTAVLLLDHFAFEGGVNNVGKHVISVQTSLRRFQFVFWENLSFLCNRQSTYIVLALCDDATRP